MNTRNTIKQHQLSELEQYREYIQEYQGLMKIGDIFPVEAYWFRSAFPITRGYMNHEEVFLSATPGSMYGAWTVEYRANGDYYEIQRNEFSVRRVFVAPESRYKYRQDKAGYWHRKDMLS